MIVTAGEVHLQRCLDDLRNRYAGIKIAVSSPITPFRETVVERPKIDMVNEEITNQNTTHHIQRLPAFMLREIQAWNETIKKADEDSRDLSELSKDELKWLKQAVERKLNKDSDLGLIEARTANRLSCVSIRAIPLPATVVKLLESNTELIKTVTQVSSVTTLRERKELQSALTLNTREKIKDFYNELNGAFEGSGQQWNGACDLIWAFGPRGIGPNVLLNRIQRYNRPSVWVGLKEESGMTICNFFSMCAPVLQIYNFASMHVEKYGRICFRGS